MLVPYIKMYERKRKLRLHLLRMILDFLMHHLNQIKLFLWILLRMNLFLLMLHLQKLLLVVLIPGVGKEVNGAMRWVAVGPFNLQTSEFMKLFLVLYMSWLSTSRPSGSVPSRCLAEGEEGWKAISISKPDTGW